MPYLTEERKLELAAGLTPTTSGDLTYQIQQAIQTYLKTDRVNFARLAEVLGILEAAKVDFVDRVLLPYERNKRTENGDVWSDD